MSITITLDYPITDGNGNQINEITLRRIKVKDMRKARAKKDAVDMEIELIHMITGLLPEDIESMDFADYQKIQEQVQQMTGVKEQD